MNKYNQTTIDDKKTNTKNKNVLHRSCCLTTETLNNKKLLDAIAKDRDRRHSIIDIIHKFIRINKKMLSFIDLKITVIDDMSTAITSNQYAGSIPTHTLNGITQGGDIQIIPKFTNCEDGMTELCELLSILSYRIQPEILPSTMTLKCKNQLRMPLYHDACKFIDEMERSINNKWVKFNVEEKKLKCPRSSTIWEKYAIRSSDPRCTLEYPSSISTLSMDHKEWKQIKYVYDLASTLIENNKCPIMIKSRYTPKIKNLSKLLYQIRPERTTNIIIHASDPMYIKKIKECANIILNNNNTECYAWRINCAILFEKYVQHIVNMALTEIGYKSHNNIKYIGTNIPKFGLKYLEPDIVFELGKLEIVADVKYKLYDYWKSDELKDEYRHDLHQLLAYSSFESTKNKIGIFFCPEYESYDHDPYQTRKKMKYTNGRNGIENTIIKINLPFSSKYIDSNKRSMKKLFKEIITE